VTITVLSGGGIRETDAGRFPALVRLDRRGTATRALPHTAGERFPAGGDYSVFS